MKLPIGFFYIFISVAYYCSAMDTPPLRRSAERLEFAADDSEQALFEFLDLKDAMITLKARVSEGRVAIPRDMTPHTHALIKLAPMPEDSSGKKVARGKCTTSLLEGSILFDEADTIEHTLPSSLVADTAAYDTYTELESKKIKALCVFATAYEQDTCHEAFSYIITTLNSILNLEQKRKKCKPATHALHPELKGFNPRILQIVQTEAARKRQSVEYHHHPEEMLAHDAHQSDECMARARNFFKIAQTYSKRIALRDRDEYSELETLYKEGLQSGIEAFHFQGDMTQTKMIFQEIKDKFGLLQAVRSESVAKGHPFKISASFSDICGFFEYHKPVKESWQEALHDTATPPESPKRPPSPPAAPSPASQPPSPASPPSPPRNSLWRRVIARFQNPFSKK